MVGYTKTQLDLADAFLLHARQGGVFTELLGKDAEADRYLSPLFFGLYRMHRRGRLASKKDAAVLIHADHTKTVQKYVKLAEELGLVEVVSSTRDTRKDYLMPTPRLIEAVERALVLAADYIRYAAQALMINELPQTEAPLLRNEEGLLCADQFNSTNPYIRWVGDDRRPLEAGELATFDTKGGRGKSRLAKEAIAAATEVIELTSRNGVPSSQAYINRAVQYELLGDLRKANADLTKAIHLNPTAGNALGLRGSVRVRLGQYEQAIQDLTETIKIMSPGFVYSYFGRGHAYLSLGLRRESEADFKKAIELDPKFEMAVAGLKQWKRDPSDKEALKALFYAYLNVEEPTDWRQMAKRLGAGAASDDPIDAIARHLGLTDQIKSSGRKASGARVRRGTPRPDEARRTSPVLWGRPWPDEAPGGIRIRYRSGIKGGKAPGRIGLRSRSGIKTGDAPPED